MASAILVYVDRKPFGERSSGDLAYGIKPEMSCLILLKPSGINSSVASYRTWIQIRRGKYRIIMVPISWFLYVVVLKGGHLSHFFR